MLRKGMDQIRLGHVLKKFSQAFCFAMWPLSQCIFHILDSKRAVGDISQQSFLAHTFPIFTDLKLLRIADIFKLRLLSFVYKAFHNLARDCFHDLFFLNLSIHCHNTRHSTCSDQFLTMLNTLQYGLKSI